MSKSSSLSPISAVPESSNEEVDLLVHSTKKVKNDGLQFNYSQPRLAYNDDLLNMEVNDVEDSGKKISYMQTLTKEDSNAAVDIDKMDSETDPQY